MKRSIRIIAFAIMFAVIVCGVDYITGKNVYSKPVWRKIQNEGVDVLIMGNSHAYTGLDASILSQVYGRNVVILGSGSQNMEHTLEALKITLKYTTPEVVLLEVNSPCSNTREALQNEKRGILFDNLDGVNNYFYKAGGVCKTFRWDTIPEGIFQLFRPANMWTRWKTESNFAEEFGFVGQGSYAYGKYNFEQSIQLAKQLMDANKINEIENYNEKALEQFLELTEENNINVILYKSPLPREGITKTVNKVFSIGDNYSNVIAKDNMILEMVNMGLCLEDFYDSGHLNRRGAEKFTYYYGNILAERLGIEVDWNRAFGYRDESVVKNEDGTYTYMMNNYSKDCLYQFKLYVGGECIEKSEYSSNNTFSCSYDVNSKEEKVELWCSMIPEKDAELGDESSSRVYIKFMYQNDCHIEE